MNISKRKENRKYLRRGDIKEIAETADVSRQTVENWLNGEVKESDAAPYIIAKMEARKKEVRERVSKMLNKSADSVN